jgi:thiamine pyridinylase
MILIAPAQMGRGKHPLLFTDAFVLRPQAPTEVEAAARFFVSFMNSQAVQEMILMSGDVSPTAIPRYLLPATMSTFEAPRIKEDRFYQELKRAISVADPFPNTGFLNTRKALRDLLKTRLEQP